MYIIKPKQDWLDAQNTKQELEQFLVQPGPAQVPPCPGCVKHLKANCSDKCPDAKAALSSEPETYPIEDKVIPLVYGLMSTSGTQTCWSCEGHMDAKNKLTKIPRVCFYTSSLIYVQLLQKHLFNLTLSKNLSYPWHIVLGDFAQSWAVTYIIMPNLNLIEDESHLGKMQHDLKIIGDNLLTKMQVIAKQMIFEIDQWILRNQVIDKASQLFLDATLLTRALHPAN